MVESTQFAPKKRGDFKRESLELSMLVVGRIPGNDGDAEFVRYRFHRPLAYSVSWSLRYGFAFTLLSVLVIAGGLASSALAADGGHDTAIAIVGLVIAVVAAINRLWRPRLRSVARHRTANALRHQGWAFVCSRAPYDEMTVDDARATFIDEVERINKAVESIDETPSEQEDERAGCAESISESGFASRVRLVQAVAPATSRFGRPA